MIVNDGLADTVCDPVAYLTVVRVTAFTWL